MNIQKLISVFVAMLTTTMLFTTAYASESSALAQAYMSEKNLDMFTNISFEEESLQVKAANRKAEIVECGNFSDENISVCTTLLVDVSPSIPTAVRYKIMDYINMTIENLSSNEQLRIITFDAKINILQDFTSDRYDLDKAAENIKFNGTQSAVYDAVYNTIPDIQQQNDRPCFYRTILVTDGADRTNQGATKEELFLKLQANTYPIDVICAGAKKPNVQNKDLSALTRISNGRYFELYPGTDISKLFSEISVDNYFWIRAELPVELLDGSTRQIDLSDGTNSETFDIKMSVVDPCPKNFIK